MQPAASLAPFGLWRPTMADALVGVHRAHGPSAATVWSDLLAAARLCGHETGPDALERLIAVMSGFDRLTQLLGRSLRIRLDTYANLVAAQASVAATETHLAAADTYPGSNA